MKYTIIALFLTGCASEARPTEESAPAPEADTSMVQPYIPRMEPVHYKECVVTKTTVIRDCILYDLMCDDGETDMVLLCPIQYWERGEYIPTPP